jgi:beta-carotene/zeaxanthin 4-ketolase
MADLQAENTDAWRRQGRIGLLLAALVIGAWLAVHVVGVWFFQFDRDPWAAIPLLIALQAWLSIGLFIIAHDCMHRSLAPLWPKVNLWVGRITLWIYAALSFDRLVPKHFAHHRAPGTEHDPDFDPEHPRAFWPWYMTFMREYFSLREFGLLTVALVLYLLLGAPLANVLVFWAIPAVLSSIQIFFFGTYLPHREEDEAFGDDHRARSNDYPWLVSLMTCFHFGYHHEHHSRPRVPWWQLPRVRAKHSRG